MSKSGKDSIIEDEGDHDVFASDGIWTRSRTAIALDLISKMDPSHAKHYLHHVAERLREPPWVSATCSATRKWIEDDAHPPDAEGVEDALPRVTGFTSIELGDPLSKFDGGDSFYYLYQPPGADGGDDDGIVIVHSPCGDEIHKIPFGAIHYSHGIKVIEEWYEKRSGNKAE